MSKLPSQLNFIFRYINESGKTKGWLTVPGSVNEKEIVLKKQLLKYDAILESHCRDRRLILTIDPRKVNNPKISKHLIGENSLVLEIHKAQAKKLKLFIDRVRSRQMAKKHRAKLTFQGDSREFRSVTCPECGSTIDLSLLNKTTYVYCQFCETVFPEQEKRKILGVKYRLCDECNWFDRVQGYTEFYFYFLLLIYGFSWKRRYLCDSCVNQVFWKMLLINFIFILGIVPAIWMKIKSLIGRDMNLKELAKANNLYKNGQYPQANIIYSRLYKHYPKHPGLLLNQSFGNLYRDDMQLAQSLLENSLANCSNYTPAIRVLNSLQEQEQ